MKKVIELENLQKREISIKLNYGRRLEKEVKSGVIFLKVGSKLFHDLKRMYIKFHANRSKIEDLYKEHVKSERLFIDIVSEFIPENQISNFCFL